jgi:transcriptional regulator with XRE-family HTH domain
MANETSFNRWRKQVGFTQEEAADALGLSKSQVANLDSGWDRTRKKPITPSLAIRCLMTNIAMDNKPTPWPE